MNPERRRQIEQLYRVALEREPEERGAFLAEACAGDRDLRRDVESLLAERTSSEVMDRPALGGAATFPQLAAGARLGPYQIEATLGAGGMGVILMNPGGLP